MSDTEVDNSVTLDYSYYDGMDLGISLHDQIITSLDFNPEDE